MKQAAALVVLGLGASSAATPPEFPTVWNAQSASMISVWQGGTHNSQTGKSCCAKTSPQCKVQTQGMAGKQYTDMDHNRTLLSTGAQGVMSIGGSVKKQLAVVPASSGKGWTCKEYCPLQDDLENPLAFGKKAQDLGKATVDGKTVEHWQWSDTILGVVKMDTIDFYVDNSGSTPVPYKQVEAITPFGGAEIAESSNVFDDFQSGLGSVTLDVTNLDSCQKSEQCQQNNEANTRMLLGRLRPSVYDLAEALAPQQPAPAAAAAAGARPSKKVAAAAAAWPKDWTAYETSDMLINQGGMPSADGSQICCQAGYGSQCQVQSSYQAGMRYYDFTNKRQRFEDPVNGITVDDFVAHKSMLVEHNGTHDVCVKYCPIDPRDSLDQGREHFIDDNATDLGTATFDNRTAEHFQWKDTILKVITMQTTDFYADMSGATVVPLGRVDSLTPFGGPKIGEGHLSFSKFTEGTPSAEKFDIQGMDTCPQDPQCGQQAKQHYRLAARQLHTWARYEETA